MNTLAGKTILLTGGTGFIGKHMFKRLSQIPQVKPVVLSRSASTHFPQALRVVSSLDRLTPQTWLEQGINHIDLVFHLSAFTPKHSAEANNTQAIYTDNLLGTRALLESLPNPPQKIVFSSTLDVYAPPSEGQILTEDSPLDPPTLYGASKLFCEHLVRVYAKQRGCGYAILRYGHIYGPGEAAYAKLIPQTIKALLKGQSPLVYGDGSIERDFMFVGDAVEATLRAAASNNEALGPVNIVSGQSRPIRNYIELLCQLSGFAGSTQYLLDKPGGHSLRFSNQQMVKLLGSWEMCPLEEGLRQELESFKELV